jgi:uncharacterized damage-inducible protein DinB
MIRTIQDFENIWSQELEATQKVFKHLTDKSLSQAVNSEGRTLGRLAWHLVVTIPEMMGRTGLQFSGVNEKDPVPVSAKEIFKKYNDVAVALLELVKQKWNDATLEIEDDMYGQHWKRGASLMALILHQAHHRAQMTVLMRQAGLGVPGVYGPAKEEWAQWGMPAPEV